MTEWQGWQLGRAVVAFTALFYLGMWVQVTLMHWGGGFKHRAMWGPVVATPLVAAAAFVGAIS
ncbi:MAG: hypothetical protein M3N51_03070, partial [Actinomycetota bacterium]|nr:hypothetical protein [Actinomycetota bacterium]